MQVATLIKYLRVPLHSTSLILIVSFAVLIMIGRAAGLFGIPMFVIITSWFFKYSFVVLDHVIDGKHEPPVLSPEMVNPVEQRPFGLLLLILGIYVVTMQLEVWWGERPVQVLRIVLLCFVPAMVAAMSIGGRFLEALNPVGVFGIIARIPFAYTILLVTIGALWFVPIWLLGIARGYLSGLWTAQSLLPGFTAYAVGVTGATSGVLGLMLLMYLWLAMCACIGGIVYEHRNELEYDAAHSPERTEAREQASIERERDKLMDPIFAQVRGGAFANAGTSVRKLIDNSPHPLDEFRWLYA
ncbi:MAG TPA: hypothetical protein VET48_01075, partial [Steroidobacteraceae bacterium]|nr:hypothetical protein [Steroidobacteraceae bacterium]